MATFTWTADSVIVKNAKGKKTIFSATLGTDVFPINEETINQLPLPSGLGLIQWPIKNSGSGPCSATNPLYAANLAALNAKPMAPLAFSESINLLGGAVFALGTTQLDAKSFTGSASKKTAPQVVGPYGVRGPSGGVALLDQPTPVLSCTPVH